MALERLAVKPSRSWAFFFLYALRRVVPLALVGYVMVRYGAWKDPAVVTLLLVWVLAILSFRAAVRRSLPRLSAQAGTSAPQGREAA